MMITISYKKVDGNLSDKKARKNAFADGFETKTIDENELIEYLNRYHICTATFKDNYRNSNNIETIAPFIKIDIDNPEHFQDVLNLLNMSNYQYVKAPSSSYTDDTPYKLHILIFTDKPLLLNGYAYQVDTVLHRLGIKPEWIDYRVAVNPVSYFAPYRAKWSEIPNNYKELFEVIDEEISEFVDGDLAPITDDIPSQFKKSDVNMGYINPTECEDGKVYTLDELHSSDKATYLNIEGLIPYRGKLTVVSEVSKLIWAENDTSKRFSGFGCPVCNKEHNSDPITTPYAFGYLSTNGEILIQCNGNGCTNKPLYVIPNKEVKEVFDIEHGTVILKPTKGSVYLVDGIECKCINEYKNSYNFEHGYKYTYKENDLIVEPEIKQTKNDKKSEQKKNLMEDFVKMFSNTREEAKKRKSDEVEIIDGILFESQISVLVAMPNGGKTLLAQHWSREMATKGYTVTYVIEDGGIKSFDRALENGYNNGYHVVSSNANTGQSPESLLSHLKNMVNNGLSLHKHVFIFDTLKKFTDILDKKSNKELFQTFRAMTMRGASILALAHANKYLDDNGNLVYEGTGDVLADTDSLYYMYSHKYKDSSTQNALLKMEKSRATEAISEISYKFDTDDYTAKKLDKIINVKELVVVQDLNAKFDKEIKVIVEFIRKKPLTKQEIYEILTYEFATSRRQAFELINALDSHNWEIYKTGNGNEKKIKLISI